MIVNAEASAGEIAWRIDPSLATDTNVVHLAEFLRSRGARIGDDYEDLWQWSIDQPERFWAEWADFIGVHLAGPDGRDGPDRQVRSADPMPHTRWFPGSRLNYARRLLENHEGPAIVALDEDGSRIEMTFAQLRADVATFAAHLQASGVQPGDRVVGILPNVPEAVIALLATASIGAVWSVCAPEFGPGAIVARFRQLEPMVLIATPGYTLAGKDRHRQAELSEIVGELTTLRQIVWVTAHTSAQPVHVNVPSCDWTEATSVAAAPDYLEVDFDQPLWVLFSSGTTGIPKGIVHGHGGALLEQLKLCSIHDDIRPGDRVLTVASTSWVVWNGLVAALGLGATIVLLDGNPTYPLDRIWKVSEQEEVTVLGVGAGFLHACAKAQLVPARDHDLSALRVITVTGSPLSAEGFRWVYNSIGDVWLTSQSGGTDIASIFVGGVPTLPVRVGYIQAPALGVRVESWDENGDPTLGRGELVVSAPIPSMPLRFWGDQDGARYQSSYFETFPGVWRHGDYIEFAREGIVIHGRSDSTLNRNGIRLGSADIYSVVEALPEIAEAMIVGVELGTDYYMPLFIALAPGADPDEAKTAIEGAIRANLSARYLPDDIIVMPGIPHTKTGKKLEVPIKRLLQGRSLEHVVDPGAVDDPVVLARYVAFAHDRIVGWSAHG